MIALTIGCLIAGLAGNGQLPRPRDDRQSYAPGHARTFQPAFRGASDDAGRARFPARMARRQACALRCLEVNDRVGTGGRGPPRRARRRIDLPLFPIDEKSVAESSSAIPPMIGIAEPTTRGDPPATPQRGRQGASAEIVKLRSHGCRSRSRAQRLLIRHAYNEILPPHCKRDILLDARPPGVRGSRRPAQYALVRLGCGTYPAAHV